MGTPTEAIYLTTAIAVLTIVLSSWLIKDLSSKETFNHFPLTLFTVTSLVLGFGMGLVLPPDYWFYAAALGILGSLSVIRPSIGVAVILFFWVTRPWEQEINVGLLPYLPRLWILLVAIGILFDSSVKRLFFPSFDKITVATFIIITWLSLTSVFAVYKDESFNVVTSQLLQIAVFLFLFAQVRKEYVTVILSLGVSSASIGIIALIKRIEEAGLYHLFDKRLTGIGMWSNSNDLAAVLLIGLPVVLFAKGENKPFPSIFKFLVSALLLFVIWLTQSRSALLALALGVSLVVISFKVDFFKIALVCLLGMVTLFASALFTRSEADLEGSSSARINYAVTGIKMFASSPVWGIGVGNYMIRFEEFTTDFSEYGRRTAHSSWIEYLSEGGIVGFVLYLYVFIVAFRAAFRVKEEHPEILSSLAAYSVMTSTLSHAYIITPYVLYSVAYFAGKHLKELKKKDSAEEYKIPSPIRQHVASLPY